MGPCPNQESSQNRVEWPLCTWNSAPRVNAGSTAWIPFQNTDPRQLAVRKSPEGKYFAFRRSAHKPEGFLASFQHHLASKATFCSFEFLMPKPPSFLGYGS